MTIPGAGSRDGSTGEPFFPGATFEKTDGVKAYHDITPRFGAAYDLFGNGKTALKVNLGKYLQGASVSNLAYGANPSLRIPGGGGGLFAPSVTRTWADADGDFVPDCDLNNLLRRRGNAARRDDCARTTRGSAAPSSSARSSIRTGFQGGASVRRTGRSACRCSRSCSRARRSRSPITTAR